MTSRDKTHQQARDHGGGVDAARAYYGGDRKDWIDLSTGVNPHAYRPPSLSDLAWTALPDHGRMRDLEEAARRFWRVPDGAGILAAPGASALIARIPSLVAPGHVHVHTPTYNEHAAAFAIAGWTVSDTMNESDGKADARVLVHPNNPDGRVWSEDDANGDLIVIDESFCDVCPDRSLVRLAEHPGVVILKSFGKFWGLAGLRLGFAIARPETISCLSDALGPWPVSGPALEIGAAALRDPGWAENTRDMLASEAARLDDLIGKGAAAGLVGGTSLFRLYDVEDAAAMQDRLARHYIWTRIFPYSRRWIRLGLPPADAWQRLEAAL